MSESPNRVYRGGHWYNVAKYVVHEARGQGFPDRAVVNLGFRLVHDSEGGQVSRGGGWLCAGWLSGVAYSDVDHPANCIDFVGFRLVRDREGM